LNNQDFSPIAVVTGANGFVGSHLVDELLIRGYQVRCILRPNCAMRWLEGKAVENIFCGLSDAAALREAVADANYIFHVAGVVKSPTYAGFLEGNVAPTQNLLEAALGAPDLRRVVVVSSLAAAGPNEKGKPRTETDAPAPVSDYGRSKVAQEALAQAYMSQLPITIVRPPSVYGERDTEVLLFFQTIERGIFPSAGVFAEQTLSMVHVADLVRGMVQAAESETALGQTYFLSSDPAEYTWSHIAALIGKNLNKRYIRLRLPHIAIWGVAGIADFFALFTKKTPTLNRKKVAEIVQPSWACISRKAAQDFGYHPTVPLDRGIAFAIGWYQEEGLLQSEEE
jgi:dihydroflavonol-4-reductase